MTTTSDTDTFTVLFSRGEYFVTTIMVKDDNMVDLGNKRRTFALVHRPTRVIVSTGAMLAGMIQVAVVLDEQLKDVKANPDKLWKSMQDGDGDAPIPSNFQF